MVRSPSFSKTRARQVLTVAGSMPINTVKELIDYAKANPGKLSYASSGIGSIFHLNGENLKLLTGIDMVHVPYKGTTPAMQDLLAGRVQLALNGMATVVPYVKSGKLVAIAMTTRKRSPALPDVPGEPKSEFLQRAREAVLKLKER